MIALGLLIALSSKVVLSGRAALDKRPEVLADRASEVIANAGWTDPPADSLYGFLPNLDYFRHIRESEPASGRWSVVEQVQPAMVHFAYRQSPQLLVRNSAGSIGGWFDDPAPTLPGMVEVRLDAEGRLIGFHAVPPREIIPTTLEREPDWDPLFEAAGLKRERFESVEPRWTPPSYANLHAAWEGLYPEGNGTPIRLEAAAFGDLPVAFRIIEPWTQSRAITFYERAFEEHAGSLVSSVLFFLLLGGAAFLALRNVRLGRGDRKTALRFALYLGAVRMLWLIGAHHLPSNAEELILRSHLAWSLFRVGIVYVFYLALEPYARRLWPRMLVSWVRLIGGRVRDPLVGRDLLVGVVYGAVSAILGQTLLWIPQTLDTQDYGLRVGTMPFESLLGLRQAATAVASIHAYAVFLIFVSLMTLLVLRILFRKSWIAIVLATVVFFFVLIPSHGSLLIFLPVFIGLMALHWAMLFRFGLLTMVVGATVRDLLEQLPLTLDLTAWYADATLLTLALVLTLAGWGFWASLAGRPLFRDEILETDGAR